MRGKIFISYRRDDSGAHALNVAQYLQNKLGRERIFIDIDGIHSGQNFRKVIYDKLDRCKITLAIIGPNWVVARDEKSGGKRLDNPEDWVRLEIEGSWERKIPVVPVLVSGAKLPSKSDLPASLQPLVDYHAATVAAGSGFRNDMEGLARDVAELMERRPWGRMTAAALAILLGVYVTAHLPWRPPFPPPRPAPPDPAIKVPPGSGTPFQDPLGNGEPCPKCPEMVVAPDGSFEMGEEGHQHPVTFARPFAVGRYAVTFEQWDACVADGKCEPPGPNAEKFRSVKRGPVAGISWDQANAYSKWLSSKTGRFYRLLSEAEREYVTRARTTTSYWWGKDTSSKQANFGNSSYSPVSVEKFAANPWGLYQVHGNLWEWTQDCWHGASDYVWHPDSDYPAGAPKDGREWITDGDCSRRVVRGGAWNAGSEQLRSSNREAWKPTENGNLVGFRVARALSPDPSVIATIKQQVEIGLSAARQALANSGLSMP
ncbi:SUMF1/EgtB/PvdO family nonheme iron enzyme [Methylosinus sp. LW4]|uniref:SUMF1/EgtB/PvdO family nonheme iron enzyme n=1 Tax=Methylosinus sp. LW4 TaxID=136993 RepID=UPI0018DEDCBE|nr:SUMF1/EgtB/PvdO family nonheme iron enzyme [Methylosinus sp. LW4]